MQIAAGFIGLCAVALLLYYFIILCRGDEM